MLDNDFAPDDKSLSFSLFSKKKGTHIHGVHHVASLSPIEPNSLAGHGVQLKFRKPEQLRDLVEYPI